MSRRAADPAIIEAIRRAAVEAGIDPATALAENGLVAGMKSGHGVSP